MAADTLDVSFKIDGIDPRLAVAHFNAREGISSLFELRATLTCEDPGLIFADAVGHSAALTMERGGERRFVHGIVSRFEQGDEGKNFTVYHVAVVPKAWRLKHRRDARIFQDLDAPAIIAKVLAGAGITDHRFTLERPYKQREYCVQYDESDWDFVSRLMEDEGMHCFFDHEEKKHTLVIGDGPFAAQPISGVDALAFHPPGGAITGTEHVARFRYAEEVRPGKVTLRDFNFKRPDLLLEGTNSSDLDTDLEIYDYPGIHETPPEGGGRAMLRLAERQVLRRTAAGQSAVSRLVPGHQFSLTDHPRDAYNRRYLITQVEHRSALATMGEAQGSGGSYENEFVCIPDDVPYRPPHFTPRPIIRGIQTAIVVGPAGEEIYTDEHGRVKVQFHWDREGKRDEKSSCWIRVSQIWAGAAWGSIYIPRIGHEVIVDFLEGNPDRPVITGRLYHGTNVPPYALPAEKTKSTIKSDSSPGGEGYNELRFEDKKGHEEIWIHGEKDWNIVIRNNKTQNIGNDEQLQVGHDRGKSVGNDQSTAVSRDDSMAIGRDAKRTVGRDETHEVSGNRTKTVQGGESETIGGDKTISVAKNHDETITGEMSLIIQKKKTEAVTDDSDETVGGKKTTNVDKDYLLTVHGKMATSVEKDQEEDVGGSKTVVVGEKIVLHCGDGKITVEKNGNITVEGKDITVKGTGTVTVQGNEIDVKADGAVNVEAGGDVKVKGSSISMN